MNSDRVANWLTVGANIGILIGLVMVYLQMEQSEELARYEFSTRFMEHTMAQHLQMMGDETSVAMSTAASDPESLTDAQLQQINAYLMFHVTSLDYLQEMENAGMFLRDGTTKSVARGLGRNLWGQNEVTRRHFNLILRSGEREWHSAVSEGLSAAGIGESSLVGKYLRIGEIPEAPTEKVAE